MERQIRWGSNNGHPSPSSGSGWDGPLAVLGPASLKYSMQENYFPETIKASFRFATSIFNFEVNFRVAAREERSEHFQKSIIFFFIRQNGQRRSGKSGFHPKGGNSVEFVGVLYICLFREILRPTEKHQEHLEQNVASRGK